MIVVCKFHGFLFYFDYEVSKVKCDLFVEDLEYQFAIFQMNIAILVVFVIVDAY